MESVVVCRVCGRVAPSSVMERRAPTRPFSYQKVLPKHKLWVCRDGKICLEIFKSQRETRPQ